jgi:hypothetical protein
MADIILKDPEGLLLGAELTEASLTATFASSVSGVVAYPEIDYVASESGIGAVVDQLDGSSNVLSLNTIVGGIVSGELPSAVTSVTSAVGCVAEVGAGGGILIKVTSTSATVTFA